MFAHHLWWSLGSVRAKMNHEIGRNKKFALFCFILSNFLKCFLMVSLYFTNNKHFLAVVEKKRVFIIAIYAYYVSVDLKQNILNILSSRNCIYSVCFWVSLCSRAREIAEWKRWRKIAAIISTRKITFKRCIRCMCLFGRENWQ